MTSRPFAENMRGAVFMMVAMGAFTVNDAFMALSLKEIGLFQALFLRGLVATACVALLAWRAGALRLRLKPADRRLVGLRSAAEVGGTVAFISALASIGLPLTSAVVQVVPLAITLGAALFLGERVGWRRMAAIGTGFAGVLMIVRPDGSGANLGALAALLSVAFIVARDLVTRRLSPAVPSLLVTLVTAAVITLTGAAGSLVEPWAPVPMHVALWLLASAGFLMLGYHMSILTMRTGEIGFAAPFRYTSLVWALLLGALVFGDVPGPVTLSGAGLVVAAGLYTFWRERRLARAARLAASRG